MEALLIPLAKGLFGLLGVSSFFFMSVRENIEVEIDAVEIDEVRPLEARPKLEIEPLKE